MAGTAVKIAVLMIVVASVCLEVCKACGECGGTPSIPVYKPPKSPKTPNAPRAPRAPPIYKTPPRIYYPPPKTQTCPVALVQLGVCSPLLGGIVSGILPASKDCCALLNLLGVDLEVCLCLAIDANVLGLITIDAKVNAIVSILTSCGYNVPPNFSCPL